jgi:hypothetical protein
MGKAKYLEGIMTNPTRSKLRSFLLLAISVTIIAILLASCGQAMAPATESEGFSPPSESMGAASATVYEEADWSSNQEQQVVEHLVIKNADLSLVVSDPAAAMDRISKLADEMGGFVVSANLYHQQLENGTEVPQANITIRVPAEKLNQAMERIRQESDQLPLSETLSSEDVTREYTDLKSRLRNLEEAEAQLRTIMDDANRTEDVLSVYNELVRVREEIEVIKGQIQYYEQSAALSAISTSLLANEAVQPLTIGRWQPGGVAKQAIQALIGAFKFVINAAIWIILFVLPTLALLVLIFILPVYLLLRVWRRRRKAKATLQQAAPPTEPDQIPG